MKKRLEKALKEFNKKNIAVIGDLMLDRTGWGEISKRINPEDSKVNIVKVNKELFYLGGAGNVARNIASLGANSTLYGVLGNDFYRYRIQELAKEGKVDIENLVEVDYPTIVKSRIFINEQYDRREDLGENGLEKINQDIQRKLLLKINENIGSLDGIILSDYDKHLFSEEFAKKVIYFAKEKNVPIFADVKPQNINYFYGSKIICPNKKEAEEITGIIYEPNEDVRFKIGKSLAKKIGSEKAIITLGEEGAYLYESGKGKMIPAKKNGFEEVTGAGDTFISTLALGITSGLETSEAVELANYAAGIVVGKQGTATTNIQEILESMNKER